MRRLMAYHWPGNVRQLENAIERAVAFTAGRSQIDVGDLPTEIQQAQEPALASAVDAARRRRRSRRVHRQHRARVDPAIARAHRRQQRAGGATAEFEAHDAGREAQTSRQRSLVRIPGAWTRSPARIDAMPPRYAYWTILIDDTPTAFRAREREELLPTFTSTAAEEQERRDAVVRARPAVGVARGRAGRLSAPQARGVSAIRQAAAGDARGGDWRPGGTHKDPRDRFKKKNRPERAWSDGDVRRDREKLGPPRGDKPWQGGKPAAAPARRSPVEPQAAWRRAAQAIGRGAGKPPGPPRRSALERQAAAVHARDRPWSSKPPGDRRAEIGRGRTRRRQRATRRSALEQTVERDRAAIDRGAASRRRCRAAIDRGAASRRRSSARRSALEQQAAALPTRERPCERESRRATGDPDRGAASRHRRRRGDRQDRATAGTARGERRAKPRTGEAAR